MFFYKMEGFRAVTGIGAILLVLLVLSKDAGSAWLPQKSSSASLIQQLLVNPTPVQGPRSGYANYQPYAYLGPQSNLREGYSSVQGNVRTASNQVYRGVTPAFSFSFPQTLGVQGYKVPSNPVPVVTAPLTFNCPSCPAATPALTCPVPAPAPLCPASVPAPFCPVLAPVPVCPAPVPAPVCPPRIPVLTCPAPVPAPVCPAQVCPPPIPVPTCPAPVPAPVCPEPVCPAPTPALTCPAPDPSPVCPAPVPAPVCPEPIPPPTCPEPVPAPECPAPIPDPTCPAPVPAPACPVVATGPVTSPVDSLVTVAKIMDVDNWQCSTKSGSACVLTGPGTSAPAPGTHCDWFMPVFCDDAVNAVAVTLAVTPAAVTPPAGYTLVDNQGYFKLHTEQKTFAQAKDICASEGAILAVPLTPADYTPLLDIFLSSSSFIMKTWTTGFYVGFTDNLVHLDWDFSETDQRLCTVGTFKHQPIFEALAGENCTTLGFARNPDMQDVPCTWVLPFLCQQKLPSRYKLMPCN